MEPTLSTMVHDLDDCGRLDDWGVEFVDSMLKRLDSDPELERLSTKQEAKVRELWGKHCG